MRKLIILFLVMFGIVGSSFADMDDPVQHINENSVSGYYADSERTEGQIIFTRTSSTRNKVSIEVIRDTGRTTSNYLNGREYTFKELTKKRLRLDFSKAAKLSRDETQVIVIDLNLEVSFTNPDGMKVTNVEITDSRVPHRAKIKTWFLEYEDDLANIVLLKD